MKQKNCDVYDKLSTPDLKKELDSLLDQIKVLESDLTIIGNNYRSIRWILKARGAVS